MLNNEDFLKMAAAIGYYLQMYCHPDWVILKSYPLIEAYLFNCSSSFSLEYLIDDNIWSLDTDNVPLDIIVKINEIINNIEKDYDNTIELLERD